MKISKAQKIKNRQSILDAFVKLSKDKKFKEVSMKAIAKSAGLSDAAIYNYFASKEELITGYFLNRIELTIELAQSSKEFQELVFSDKIQWFIEFYLEKIEKEEGIIRQSMHHLVEQPIAIAKTGLGQSKKIFVEFFKNQMDLAVSNNEFSEPPFSGFICELLWDMHLGVIHYWLNDKSAEKLNTSNLIELSINLFQELLNGDIFNKFYKVGHFLFKEHLLSKLLSMGAPVDR